MYDDGECMTTMSKRSESFTHGGLLPDGPVALVVLQLGSAASTPITGSRQDENHPAPARVLATRVPLQAQTSTIFCSEMALHVTA
jgi:hypothetical protein